MRWVQQLTLRLRTLLRRNTVERELDAELRFHLEQQIAENIANGMAPDEARYSAMRSLRSDWGGLAQVQEECRDARGLMWLDSIRQDIRYSLRQLRRAPGFTAVAVITLALGIGANTAIFTVMNALMFKALPVPEPETLVELNRGSNDDVFSYAMFRQIEQQQDVFSGVFATTLSQADLSDGGAKRLVFGMLVSGDYFQTLRVPMILGRAIAPDDDQYGSPSVAVISYGFWQRQFGGDPGVIGRSMLFNKHPFQIIGVTPQGFFGTETGQQFDFALPLHATATVEPSSAAAFEDRQTFWLNVLARLKPGITLDQARARLRVLAPALNMAVLPPKIAAADRDEFLKTPLDAVPAATGISVLRYRYAHSVVLLACMVGIVLLIACANIANLLLARASAHEHDFAVRAALGAKRTRVLRQVLTESLMLSSGGVIAGLVIARWGSKWLVAATTSARFPAYLDLSPDLRVAAFLAAIALITALLFGFTPALRLSNIAPHGALKEGARATFGRAQNRTARLLIAGQIGLSVVLLFGAELLVGSVRDLLNQDLGFQSNSVLLIQADFDRHPAGPEREALVSDFLSRLHSLPGVQAASRSIITPISGMSIQANIQPVGRDANTKPVHAYRNIISPGYFDTLGIPLIAGRDFDERDTASSPRVAILDQSAARKLFPNQDPLGRTYRDKAFREQKEITVTVVGLAKDAKYRRLRDEPPPTIYLPIAQNPMPIWGDGTFEVRASGPIAPLTNQIEKMAQSVDPALSFDITSLSSQVGNSLRQERLMAQLSSIFSALALLLAAVGIYGALSYAVARRTGEIGIRMALGACRSDVARMVVREALLVAAAGLAVGVPAALMASKLIGTFLFGVKPSNPIIVLTAIAVITAVACLAAYLPARRAARVDPMVALRYE